MLVHVKNRYRGQEVDQHPHAWSLPESSKPSRRLRTRSANNLPHVPSPSIYRDVSIPYSITRNHTAPPTWQQYPAPGHVASHLLLLECFHDVRMSVESSKSSDQNMLPNEEWIKYLKLAIRRFKLWITKIESVLRHSAVFNQYGTGSHLHGAFTVNYLPPKDVLLVWYCYLQSSAAYERLLASNNFTLLSQICFPWDVIAKAIDHETLSYKVSSAAEALWRNLVGISFDMADFEEPYEATDRMAFTSDAEELLELTIRQTEVIEDLNCHQWLRSPTLEGTLKRGLTRYAGNILSSQTPVVENTQQIPVGGVDTKNIKQLEFDVVCQLVLNTHRAFHSAWKLFTQQYNLGEDDGPPPPSYEETQSQNSPLISARFKQDSIVKMKELDECYCWLCERIKDEQENTIPPVLMTSISPVSSPEEIDEKKSTISVSSSCSSEASPNLDLSKKEIQKVKADVQLYRHVEALRQERLRKRSI